jgi:hypothetical protein
MNRRILVLAIAISGIALSVTMDKQQAVLHLGLLGCLWWRP